MEWFVNVIIPLVTSQPHAPTQEPAGLGVIATVRGVDGMQALLVAPGV